MKLGIGTVVVVAAGVLAAQSQDGATGLPAPGSYRVDPETSWAGFRLKATLHTVHGQDGAVEGTFRLAVSEAGGWDLSGEIAVDASTLQTGNERRDRKMRDDILEVARFPSLLFRPRTASLHADDAPEGGGRTLLLIGELEIRGITRPVELPVQARFEEGRLTLDGSFAVTFEDFEVPDPSVFLLRVQKQVLATVHLESVLEAE
jgi:polyisoprenoid-binding protein YceI